MKSLIAFITIALWCISQQQASAQFVIDAQPPAWGIGFDEVHRALTDNLVDPRSAQYKRMLLVRGESGATLCGLMNWRDGQGHYQPFVPFYYQALAGDRREAFVAPSLDDAVAISRMAEAGCPAV